MRAWKALLASALFCIVSPSWAYDDSFVTIGESSTYKFAIKANSLRETNSGGEDGLVAIVRHTVKKTNQVSDNIFLIPIKSCQDKKGVASVISLDGETGVEMPFVLGSGDATSIIAQVFCEIHARSSATDKPVSNSISI